MGKPIIFIVARAIAAMVAIVAGVAGCGAQSSDKKIVPSTQNARTLRAVAGYVTPDDLRGVAAIGNGVLTEVSPVWYQPTDSGQLIFASAEAQQSAAGIAREAASHQVALVPSIVNYRNGQWDGAVIHRIITNSQISKAHIAAIVSLVASHDWAGVDVDYESLAAGDRSAYSRFISDLALALHHAQKRLTVTAHAKIDEPGDWSGARAQDWRALGASADEVRVMAYDYSTEDSPPGPIAPLHWVESVLQLAVSEVPRDKLMLGVATYGYDWPNGKPGGDVQWADAQAIAESHAARVMWDATSQSPWFTYADKQGRQHTVWYENARSLKAKVALAASYRLNGIVIWRLGGEDPGIWEQIRQTA